ncbi:YchJ family protein [Yersinia nurmii]|uniref:UPF0225 protein QVN42_04140 n=1 Tax=Yersinia nurmii TaxID=685706 RepID=A0AAW7JV47_9GAMM|nr:YchJ family protein [Yersinia nurmii]MDN0086593.1 YchJ family protein [Yersinia nurmii]
MTESCPCGSRINYELCCEPYILGAKVVATPGILMRSRYSAYVKEDVNYLVGTWHPDCHAEEWRDNIVKGFVGTQWLGLTVREETAGSHPDEGFVEFVARFKEDNSDAILMLHERSRFLRLNERWYYIDGIRPQVGRNDSCPCGSGKKYKKCCG